MVGHILGFLVASIAVAILTGVSLDVDLRSHFGVGVLIGYWLFAGGIALAISHIPAAIYWLVKRKRMPGVIGMLWVSWAILAVLCFVGSYVRSLK